MCQKNHLKDPPTYFELFGATVKTYKNVNLNLFSNIFQEFFDRDSPNFEDDCFNDDVMMIDLLQFELKNVEKICEYLLAQVFKL